MYTKLEILILYTCTCKRTIDYVPTSLWLLFCLHSQYEVEVIVGVAVPGGSADVILGAWTIAVEKSCRERQGRRDE